MSDPFIASARVLITPDTTRFRRELEGELAVITSKPITVPVQAQIVGTATAATRDFTAAQQSAAGAVLGLESGMQAENAQLARGAVLLEASAAAAKEDAAAQQAAGIAKTQNAQATKALATQQGLAATATAKLALAQEAVAGAASAAAAASIQFTRAQAATVAAERALGAAIAAKNIALVDAASQSLRVAAAYEAEALAALNAARAETIHGRTLGSVGTAAIANTASLLGLRGAVLTAGAAFLGATVAFQSVAKSIKAATDTTEELNKSAEVFEESSAQIQDFAETTATSLGISNVEALRAAGIFGNLFRSINIGTPAAAAMSEQLVRLAADLASFNNADPSQVLDNLRSGLVGEPEPLRKFGIFLSQARAQQEALIETGKKSVKELTQAEIVQARYNLILRDSTLAQGDFARTSESLANQNRLLQAQIQDLGAQFGQVLIPALRVATGVALEYVSIVREAASATKTLANAIPGLGANIPGTNTKIESLVKNMAEFSARSIALGPVVGGVTFAISKLRDSTDETIPKVSGLNDALDAGARAARLAAFAIVSASNAVADLGQTLNALEVAQLQIQTGLAPGGRGAEIANLEAQIAADKEAVAAAKSGSKARRQALLDLRSDQKELEALQKEIAREGEQAANDARSAAERAAQARREADEALLDLLSNRRDDQTRRVARASETSGLQDDIRAQNSLQALIKQQIQKVRDRVRDEQARKDAIRELRIALIASREEERKLRQEQREEQQLQIDTVQQLNIDIAIERGNTAAAERAILTRINRLNKQIKAARDDQVKVKQLILERERLRKQLRELRKTEEDARNEGRTAQQFFFEQLQAQQGFAANLLGNLIPSGQTAGLVGQPSPDVGARVTAEANRAEGIARVGPTAGQANTQVDVLRKILQELRKLNGSYDAPEAIHQKKVGAGSMDNVAM